MKILGIDLGTTNSAVGLVNKHGQPELIANRDGEYITPSVVFFEEEQPIFGGVAKRSAALDPEAIVQFVKRQMGNPDWAFVTAQGTSYSAEEISALILRRLKEDAEAYTGERFTHAVISVPAYFQDAQRQATIDAANIAGLEVSRIINEPTAAALAFAVDSSSEGDLVVYDLGGGTFDATAVRVGGNEFKVLATGGDRSLGGVDWDNTLMLHLNKRFMEATGIDLLSDAGSEQDLRDKAETSKLSLSGMSSAKVVLSAEGKSEVVAVTREEFEEMTSDLLERTRVILEEVVEDAGLVWGDIKKVLLVGGSTKMPAIARLLEEMTGTAPSREVHPDEAVALGAAVQAAVIVRDEHPPAPDGTAGADEKGIQEVPDFTDVTAHSLGVLLFNAAREKRNVIVVDRNTELPCSIALPIHTMNDEQPNWFIEVTQGEDTDMRYVSIVGTGRVNFDSPKPAGYPLRTEWRYDRDGLIHVGVFDANTNAFFGDLDIKRESNLSQKELKAKRERINGMELD